MQYCSLDYLKRAIEEIIIEDETPSLAIIAINTVIDRAIKIECLEAQKNDVELNAALDDIDTSL